MPSDSISGSVRTASSLRLRSPTRSSRSCNAVDASCAAIVVEPLQLAFERLEHVGVDELAQLGVAHQLAQLRVIDRQRLCAPLGQRRVAVVQEVAT